MSILLMLLLLSRFSCVQLCATPETAAHQVPPSLGFCRQEYWSGLPFPSPEDFFNPGIEPGSPVFSALQADYLPSELLLLSHFSCVRLCATPETAAHQAPPSLGFSRQKHYSVFLQSVKVKSESEIAQSCPTLSDPMDCSLPGSSVHGIFQARVLE